MERKKLGRTLYLTIIWMIVILVALVSATYAWFSFSPFTNVTPMSGNVGEGSVNLLISNQKNGKFDRECKLILESTGEVLSPMSTANLSRFYISKAQNRKGISILFADASGQANSKAMHGKVYLKSDNGNCDVYLRRSGLSFGQNSQTLAALRLGLKISASDGNHTYILKLDDLGNTGSAEAKRTVASANSVISSVDGKGNATFVKDPSLNIGRFLAKEQGADDQEPRAGDSALCRIRAGETATVEYWLYLEGCDNNCIGDVQNKDINLKLSFSGVVLD